MRLVRLNSSAVKDTPSEEVRRAREQVYGSAEKVFQLGVAVRHGAGLELSNARVLSDLEAAT